MGGKTYLGEFEHMVLAAILRLGEGAYGTAIIKEIETVTRMAFSDLIEQPLTWGAGYVRLSDAPGLG